jgi:hypothetical protein
MNMKRSPEEMEEDRYEMGATPTPEQLAKWRPMRCDSHLHAFRHQDPGHQEIVAYRRDIHPGKPLRGHGHVCLACAPFIERPVAKTADEVLIDIVGRKVA